MNTTRRHVGKTLTATALALATLGYGTLASAQATQGRRAAFAVGHDGHFRNGAERRGPDGH